MGRACRGEAGKDTRGRHNLARFLREKGAIHPVTGADLEDPWPAEAKGNDWWIERGREEATTQEGKSANADSEMQTQIVEGLILPQPLGDPEGAQGDGGRGGDAHTSATVQIAGEEGGGIRYNAGFDDPEAFWSEGEAEEESPW